jgi:1,2-diacylglycerol 3-beta-galactosyltransferase
VADKFCQPSGSRIEIRERLGWPQNLPVVLLVGGGEGMGPLEATARTIDETVRPVHLVVVAGRNKKLQERLQKNAWRNKVTVIGFTKEMPDLMRAANILATKAGPGTISEAFIAGLPMILYSRLPGQEDGNVGYVVSNGAGVWAPRAEAVADAVKNWLDHPDEREKAVEACLRLARPRAARDIAHQLASQVGILSPSQIQPAEND